jgi:hypothetical protein
MFGPTAQLTHEGKRPCSSTAINIDVEGFGKFNGQCDIESSAHRIKRSQGYTTEIEARLLSS